MTGPYQNLKVWQKAMNLTEAVYELTNKFPDEEKFGLTSQMRRSASSIPANIAEGKLRQSDGELNRFLSIAFSSGGELETQVEIAKRVLDLDRSEYKRVDSLLSEVMKMLNSLINKDFDDADS